MTSLGWTFVLVVFLASLQGSLTTIAIQRLMRSREQP